MMQRRAQTGMQQIGSPLAESRLSFAFKDVFFFFFLFGHPKSDWSSD